MTPTNELRFVEREIEVQSDQNPFLVSVDATGKTVEQKPYIVTMRVLQQKWQNSYWTTDESGCKYQEEEWRDVLCVKENT